jgi:predicted phosphodiesterase
MNDKKVDFLVMLGDIIDKGNEGEGEDACLKHLDAIESIFGKFRGPRYHVLGNHDLDKLSKSQFMAGIENTGIPQDATYYSYDCKGVHFVVVDACFNREMKPYDHGNFGWVDANIPPEQLAWLKKDLASTSKPVIVLVHQLLCGNKSHSVRNSDEVRGILNENKNVLSVFNGHFHRGQYELIEGIHYYTLIAMVEGAGEQNSSYAIVDVHDDNSLTVTGYRRAVSKELPAK